MGCGHGLDAEVDGQIGPGAFGGRQVLIDLLQLVVVEEVKGQTVGRISVVEAAGILLLDLSELGLDRVLEVRDLDAVSQVLVLLDKENKNKNIFVNVINNLSYRKLIIF